IFFRMFFPGSTSASHRSTGCWLNRYLWQALAMPSHLCIWLGSCSLGGSRAAFLPGGESSQLSLCSSRSCLRWDSATRISSILLPLSLSHFSSNRFGVSNCLLLIASVLGAFSEDSVYSSPGLPYCASLPRPFSFPPCPRGVS